MMQRAKAVANQIGEEEWALPPQIMMPPQPSKKKPPPVSSARMARLAKEFPLWKKGKARIPTGVVAKAGIHDIGEQNARAMNKGLREN
jgi:hypothetical protein